MVENLMWDIYLRREWAESHFGKEISLHDVRRVQEHAKHLGYNGNALEHAYATYLTLHQSPGTEEVMRTNTRI